MIQFLASPPTSGVKVEGDTNSGENNSLRIPT